MSEPFATTVAAVAPVIWLVGAVEVQQAVKRYDESTADTDARYAEVLRAVESSPNPDALRELSEWMRGTRRRKARLLPFQLVWLVLTLALCAVVGANLEWLAEDGGPGKETGVSTEASAALARFSLVVVGSGFFFITMLPFALSVIRDLRSTRAQLVTKRAIAARLAEQRQEQEASQGESVSPSA